MDPYMKVSQNPLPNIVDRVENESFLRARGNLTHIILAKCHNNVNTESMPKYKSVKCLCSIGFLLPFRTISDVLMLCKLGKVIWRSTKRDSEKEGWAEQSFAAIRKFLYSHTNKNNLILGHFMGLPNAPLCKVARIDEYSGFILAHVPKPPVNFPTMKLWSW